MKNTIAIALAFVGLLVGAGFATGQEVIQYFVGFGVPGLVGAVISGIIMAAAGAVILGLGSYFLADEHNAVFRSVTHPVMSKILDISVSITLFALGFVMLAGAGSTLEQQFAIPAWIGGLIMVALVMVTGMLDVDKVSNIISGITPLIVIAVLGVFIYTMFNLPESTAGFSEYAQGADTPVSPWWLSAINYNGLALLLGLSMCLVIGGNHSNPMAAVRGGFAGGLLYTFLLVAVSIVLYLNIEIVRDDDVPMLTLYQSIHPVLALIMVFIIFAMIYNTAIGMFYALGKRLAAGSPGRYRFIFLSVCTLGYFISLFGFGDLMNYVYPAIGYMGILVIGLLVVWWVRHRREISEEMARRRRLYDLTLRRESDGEFSREESKEIREIMEDSNIHPDTLKETVGGEVADELGVVSDAGEYQAPNFEIIENKSPH